ncbi:hypothetical protein GJ496_008828 [Pomphorhynchus laevis]|nr:hypothetical protein GJ496_008828 [Pomphorhynchus laevis]
MRSVSSEGKHKCLPTTVCWGVKKEKRKRQSELRAKRETIMMNKAMITNETKKRNTRYSNNQETRKPLEQYDNSTLSIAFSCSILRNVPSDRQAVQLLGHIARITSIFKVNEIILFDDRFGISNSSDSVNSTTDNNEVAERAIRVLEYCECPQYLRKHLFKRHPDLQFAGLLYPLTIPHHYKIDDEWIYREGVVTKEKSPENKCSYINVGLENSILSDRRLKSGLRVTVKQNITDDKDNVPSSSLLTCKIVSPNEPFVELSIYWGYRVRYANTIDEVMSSPLFNEPYDVTIGTSDKGISVDSIQYFKKYKHALIVFGGVYGLESFFKPNENDGSTTSAEYFDFYVNTCPNQGTRTIRTEEAICISLASLRPLLCR